jgi:hypothetical protein
MAVNEEKKHCLADVKSDVSGAKGESAEMPTKYQDSAHQ